MPGNWHVRFLGDVSYPVGTFKEIHMEMNWQNIINDKDFVFSRVSSLIILLFSTLAGMILIICPYIESIISKDYSKWISVGLILLVELIITGIWLHHRIIFPKGSKKTLNIVVAITTENIKQKNRIKKDFTQNIKNLLSKYGLGNSYDVIVLHNHLSKEARQRIEKYFYLKSSKNIEQGYEEKARFKKMSKKLNAKFFIYGDLISRNSPKNKFFLNIHALLNHNKIDSETGKTFHNEFNKLWKSEINFFEEEEYTGFKSTSKTVFFAATYMIGLATFVDNRFEKGTEVFKALLAHIKNENGLETYEKRIKSLLASSLLLNSMKLYFNGSINESIDLRKQYHKLTPNEYSECLTEAIFQVSRKNNPKIALEFVDRAQELADGDGTWRYSKFYLLIRLEKHKEALKVLEQILSSSYKTEFDTVNQVIAYNKKCLEDDPTHIQSNFIIGVFEYLKQKRPIQAYEKLEQFVNDTNNKENLNELNIKAKELIFEIDKIINVP
jgi:hypothetical protein